MDGRWVLDAHGYRFQCRMTRYIDRSHRQHSNVQHDLTPTFALIYRYIVVAKSRLCVLDAFLQHLASEAATKMRDPLVLA